MSEQSPGINRILLDRIPGIKQIMSVFAVIVFAVYSWTLFVSFYNLPSWVFYLSAGQIVSIYAYAFLSCLADSTLLLISVLFLDFIIFFAFKNRGEFQARTILISIIILACAMLRLYLFGGYEDSVEFTRSELVWWMSVAIVGIPLAVLLSKIGRLRAFIEAFSERAAIFLYVYLFLSGVSFLIVFFRNLG